MSSEAVTHLCALLNNDLQPLGFGGHPMPVALKVTVPLNFYTSASFQGSTGDLCGVSQSAVHLCIWEVTNALYRTAGNYVLFRTDPESQARRVIGFGTTAGFPQEQGLSDCTHVVIKAATEQPATYVNRKGFYTLNVQLVCDHRKHFLQVCPRFLGSCHDSFILRQSQVPLLFISPAQIQGLILGVKSYPLLTWLVTPVRNPSSNAQERKNACHSST
ncbi:putative nuclease HARBI1 [Heterodontus francisci]|uniref:putative nuclease HARBI1 n=1 Tax=Heterodontus francisci TaxID=7792 RepID=UPI00355AD289